MIHLLPTFLFTAMLLDATAPFHFDVYRTKLTREEPGKLEINETAVSYQSDNGKYSLRVLFSDIWEADVSDPARITLTTYDVAKRRLGGRIVYSFRLREGTHTEELSRFFAQHLQRPVVGSYSIGVEGAAQIPAYHRDVFGGSHGTLVIGPEGIQFVSKKPKDSRTWLYRDIETIGTANPFHFRVTTYAETFTLDLKERLPDSAYQSAWKEVYGVGSGQNLPRP